MTKLIFCFLVLFQLNACANNKPVPPPAKIAKTNSALTNKLYTHYNEWRGVKYQEGGMSKRGVDCSGFVHLAYTQKLHKNIPRSTELMLTSGTPVTNNKLLAGDVLFFKTGWKKRHVGIYTGKGEFIHASSSRGVIKSRLSNPYWADAYWMARRY